MLNTNIVHIYIVPFANNQPFDCLTRFLSNSTMNNVCIYYVFTNKKYKLRALEAKIIMKVILSVIFVLQCRGQKRMCPLEGYMLGRQE